MVIIYIKRLAFAVCVRNLKSYRMDSRYPGWCGAKHACSHLAHIFPEALGVQFQVDLGGKPLTLLLTLYNTVARKNR